MQSNNIIQKELMQYEQDGDLPFAIDPIDGDILHLRVTLSGPPGTPYEDGTFFLELTVPSQYPTAPPKIKFETKIYHPNINEDGSICLDQLKNDWKPNYNLEKAISFIYSLLENPNWETPLVASIAAQHQQDPALFETTAKEWTNQYAV